MAGHAKIWGIAAVAALGVAGLVLLRLPADLPLPMGESQVASDSAENDAVVEVGGTDGTQARIETPDISAPETPVRDTPRGVPVETTEVDSEPFTAVTPDDSLEISAENTAPLTAELAPQSPTAEAGPNATSELETALQAPIIDDSAGQAPQPDSQVTTSSAPQPESAPDPILPAPALGDDPTQGSTPALATDTATVPAAESSPLLGASTPLTLAQVLPPGAAPAPDQIAPSFDLVRVSPDGSALIAGRAAPGANIQVFSGTIPVAEATASARGEFVVFLDAPSATTLDLQIPAAPEGASLVVSQDDIIILPTAPDAQDSTPMVLHRTPDAVQIIQPSGLAIPSNVSLDLVSYTARGAVQLAGRGQPGNIARIYTDNTLVGEAPIASGGNWELEIAGIAEGRYMLRVDEISPEGAVESRTESPFQRQFPEANMPETFSQGAKIIVQPGNTLWLMATEAYGDGDAYSQIFSANKDTISDPNLIFPGQIFSIPRIEE